MSSHNHIQTTLVHDWKIDNEVKPHLKLKADEKTKLKADK